MNFYDFGCGDGANLSFVRAVWPDARGVGIDIDARKIELARAKGYEAKVFDILELPNEKSVSFVTMSHFLEHLPGVAMAASMIRKAVSLARDFILIRQPWFDSDGDLLQRGLKFYWSDWRGHRNKMTSLDFYSILSVELNAGRIAGFSIYGRTPVRNASNTTIIPRDAPIDQHHYDPAVHGPKVITELPPRVYREIVVAIGIGNDTSVEPLMARLSQMELLCSRGDMTTNGLPAV